MNTQHEMKQRHPFLERREAVRTNRLTRYERMLEIRAVEDRITQLFLDGQVDGTTHTCQGQEAVSVGIAAAIRPTDTVACTYRGHGHALALGLDPEVVIAELLGRTTGCTSGLGGSMHLSSRDVGLLPTFAIVGAGIPVAAGVGLSAQVRGVDDIGVAIFGDGASNIGAFHEGLNLAAIWKLPAIFIIENNVYGEYSRIDRTTPVEDLAVRASSYGIPGVIVDGQDVGAVQQAVTEAAERARSGAGPSLLEMKTYRYVGHSRSDKGLYRPPGELEAWQARDPLTLMRAALLASGTSSAELDQLEAAVPATVEESTQRALQAPRAQVENLFENVFATSEPRR